MKKSFLSIVIILSILLCMSAAFALPLSAEGEKCNHSYGEWVLAKEGSEEEQGLYQRECTVCHGLEERVIPCKSDPAIYGVLKEIDAEGTATVEIMIQNNPGFAGTAIDISYDSAILAPEQTVTAGEVIAGGTMQTNVDQEKSIVRIVVISTKNFTKDGRIATVKFKAKEGADPTVLGIRVDPNNTTNADYNFVTIYDKDLHLTADPNHIHKYTWKGQEEKYYCAEFFCREFSPCSPHNADSWTDWECLDESAHVRYCIMDSDHRQAESHVFDASCDTTCECGFIREAAECDYRYEPAEEGYHYGICDACGKEKATEACRYGNYTHIAGTNTHQGTCLDCGQLITGEKCKMRAGNRELPPLGERFFGTLSCTKGCGNHYQKIAMKAGDLNNDNKVGIADVVVILQVIAGVRPADDFHCALGNVYQADGMTENGGLTTIDATMFLRKIVGK